MIKVTRDREKILPIWQEAFGDSEEDIQFFLDYAKGIRCVGYFDGEALVGILFLVPCTVGGNAYQYVYAAATKKEYRSKGIMTEMLRYCYNAYQRLCLIPAEDSLVTYYRERGFSFSAPMEQLKFEQEESICEYLTEGWNLTHPQVLIYKGEA